MAQQGSTGAFDPTTLRRHLEALTLKLAEAQAGSAEAVKQSRRHAEAMHEALDSYEAAAADVTPHAGVSTARWTCHECGQRRSTADGHLTAPTPGGYHDKTHEPVATLPQPCDLNEPVNSL